MSGTETVSWQDGGEDFQPREDDDPQGQGFSVRLSVCQCLRVTSPFDSLTTSAAPAYWPPGQASQPQSPGLPLHSPAGT